MSCSHVVCFDAGTVGHCSVGDVFPIVRENSVFWVVLMHGSERVVYKRYGQIQHWKREHSALFRLADDAAMLVVLSSGLPSDVAGVALPVVALGAALVADPLRPACAELMSGAVCRVPSSSGLALLLEVHNRYWMLSASGVHSLAVETTGDSRLLSHWHGFIGGSHV